MAIAKLKAAILIISDTASKDPSADKAGVRLENVFAEQGATWAVRYNLIIPDNVNAIQQHILQLCDDDDDYANFVLTTGGTGFAVKDRTPEAIKPLIDRDAPGLMLVMLPSFWLGLMK